MILLLKAGAHKGLGTQPTPGGEDTRHRGVAPSGGGRTHGTMAWRTIQGTGIQINVVEPTVQRGHILVYNELLSMWFGVDPHSDWH